MRTIFLAILLIPANYGYLTCRKACRSCSERNHEPEFLEVYCEMCKECKIRRQNKAKYLPMKNRYKADDQNEDQDAERFKESLRYQRMRKQLVNQEEDDEFLQHDVEPNKPENKNPDLNRRPSTAKQNFASRENNRDRVSPPIDPLCPTPPLCPDNKGVVRPSECLMFAQAPAPLLPMYPPLCCPVYTPCVYQYQDSGFSHTTTTTSPEESITTAETTTTTTTRTTVYSKPRNQTARISHRPMIVVPAPPYFMPYNPWPNYLPPMPMAPIPILQPPTHIPQHPSNVPESTAETKVTNDHYYAYIGVPKNMLQ